MKYFLFFLLSLFSFTAFTQNSSISTQSTSHTEEPSEDEKAVMAVVVKVFDGMRAGDSTMVRSCFHSSVDMFTSYTSRKTGEPVLKKDNVKKFLEAVGTPHDEVWDEKLWDTEIRIDNNLAQVWTKYGFYLDDKFSHCGVDAFHLTRTKDGWKIFHLTDTRQRTGCEEKGK